MQSFLDRLASAEPTPGGGGGAAAMAAIGAALLSMAARHSLAKKIAAPARTELEALLSACEALRARFVDIVDADARAFDRFMEACRLRADDPAAAAVRAAAMEAGMREATRVPLDCARDVVDALRLARRCVEISHRNVAGDAAAGALALLGALRICELNVSINARSLRDAGYARAARQAARALLDEGLPLAENARQLATERLEDKGEEGCSATSKSPNAPP